MSAVFGRDVSDVRLHGDDHAGETAARLGANAYTFGSHIFLSRGHRNVESTEGRRLPAHELTHVMQLSDRRALPANANRVSGDRAVEAGAQAAESYELGPRPRTVQPLRQQRLPACG